MSVGGNDLSGLPSTCTVDTCAGNVLRVCNTAGMFEDQTCSVGCSSTGAPHCASVVPQSPILPADLNASGLVPIVLAVTTTVHGDTGAIDGIRSANVSATTREINNGIAFHIANGVSIFSFASLKVDDAIVVHLVGPNAIALVAAGDVELIGQVEARSCPSGGAGGAAPATGGQSGTGQGFGTVGSQVNTSGGGAGHGDKGGHGANDMAVANEAAGGAIYGVASLNPLSGGSSGAGGSFAGSVPVGGRGGAGGGALQLVAAGKVVLGGGNQPGGVNAGGCGGGQGAGGGATGSGGGGGGSGGAILVEAAAIEIRSNGGLAANGGGGGSQGGSGSPQYNGGDASLSSMRAAGGFDGGGRGGAAGAPLGESYDFVTNSGGGGGGAGRIRLNSASGSATLPASYILSPGLNDMNMLGQPVCTQGVVTTQ
jgi:hypothetical protein